MQKGLPLPGLLLLALRHVLGGVEDGAGPSPAVAADQHRRGPGPAALLRQGVLAGDGQLAVLNGQKGPVPAQAAAEIFDGHDAQELRTVAGVNEPLGIGADAVGVLNPRPQKLAHLLQLGDILKGVRQKVHVISSEKHAAEASDDVQLLLVLILPVGLPVLLAGDVPAQDVHQNLAGLAAVDHVLLQPAGRLLPGPVLADLLRVIQRFQRLLPDDLQGHGVPEGLGVLLADQGGQSALHMLDIVIRLEILGAGGLPQVDPLAQARVQVDGVHDAVPALQDGGHLHIPLAALQLLPDPVLGVLEGQHHVPLTVPLLGEAGVDGDIAVQVAVAGPLAEELHPGNFPLPGPARTSMGPSTWVAARCCAFDN